MGSNCFKCSKTDVNIKDNITEKHEILRPTGVITALFSKSDQMYILKFSLDKYHKYCFRLWSKGARSPYTFDPDSDFGFDSENDEL